LRPIKAAIIHIEDLATFTASVDARVKGIVALIVISAIIPATIPNIARSAQNRDLNATDPMPKIKSVKEHR
jgi:hypothetical protein